MGAIIAKKPKALSFDRECGSSGNSEAIAIRRTQSLGQQRSLKSASEFFRKSQYSEKLHVVPDAQDNPILDLLFKAKTSDTQETCLCSIAEVRQLFFVCFFNL